MSIPKYPFQLLIREWNGNSHLREYATLQECTDAAKKIPAAMCSSYRISVTLEFHNHDDPRPTSYRWPHGKLKIS